MQSEGIYLSRIGWLLYKSWIEGKIERNSSHDERDKIQWKGEKGWAEGKKSFAETQQRADASILYDQICCLHNQSRDKKW